MKRQADIHWSDVKAALEKKGSSLVVVALSLGITKPAVSKAKYRPVARVQKAIAKVLGKKPSALWPTRYHHLNGRAIPAAIWLKKNSRAKRTLLVKNRKAA